MTNKFIICDYPDYFTERYKDRVKIILGESRFIFAKLENYWTDRWRDVYVKLENVLFNDTDLRFTKDSELICVDGTIREEWNAGDPKRIEIFEMDEDAAISYFELKRAMTI